MHKGIEMENAVYWNGLQIGIEVVGIAMWFPSAPAKAIEALTQK